LSYAVTIAVEGDRAQAPSRLSHRTYSDFFADWGVEVAMDLTVSENTTVNPTGTWFPHSPVSAVFSIAGGISGGAVATNQNQYNIFYPLSELYRPTMFKVGSERRQCRNPRGNKEGSPLVDIDLQILPLLESRIQVVQLGLADSPGKTEDFYGIKNVLTQTVSIKETVSGDVTPTWAFTNSSINSDGKLFSTGRERTHQIVFTFGPLAKGRQSLTPLAESFHLNEQLKAGLRNSQLTQ
jgi:hypothetical protein